MAATLHCFTGARLLRLETALRTAIKLSEDDDTVVQLAVLISTVMRRRHVHEDQCPVCLFWEQHCRRQ
jgi:hypothetical protein